MKKLLIILFRPLYNKYLFLVNKADKKDVDELYKLLYDQVHNSDRSLPIAAAQAVDTFGFQWDKLKEGEAMLTDKWFKENVENIITDKEILIKADWFKGKDVIDCGCGGGRWSYGLAKLGANITAVDINSSAIAATSEALQEMKVQKNFIQTPLENLSEHLPADKKYDLVWSWGVLHHCGSFTTALNKVSARVKEGGFIYLYLYGRETVSYEQDINLFKSRVRYNNLKTWEEKKAFLLEKSNGDETKLHQNHDMFAPLLNRRYEFEFIKKLLEERGFVDVTRTVNYTELHIRAVKTKMRPEDETMVMKADKNVQPWYLKYFV